MATFLHNIEHAHKLLKNQLRMNINNLKKQISSDSGEASFVYLYSVISSATSELINSTTVDYDRKQERRGKSVHRSISCY